MNWRDNPMENLHAKSKLVPRLALLLSLLLLGSREMEAKPKKKPSPTPTPVETPTPLDKSLEVPIPIGHEAMGVRIPVYGAEGKLQMMIETEIAFRLDLQQLQMTNLKIETYDETDGKPEMSIDMPHSIYNLKTKEMKSSDPVTIRRNDFMVTGTNMVFDTKTKEGKFTGFVRMLIYNLKNDAQPTENPEGPKSE